MGQQSIRLINKRHVVLSNIHLIESSLRGKIDHNE